MAVSKIIFGGNTLIDLTADTVAADKLLTGVKAHGADGEVITGTCDFDANTQDATASASEILLGKTAYNKANKLTGTMPNNGAVTGTINTKAEAYTVPQGYHDGSGKVAINATEQAKIIADNIREGITILGVVGTMTGSEDVKAEPEIIVTPSSVEQVILPHEGFTHLTQVTVKAIPYDEIENSAGGITVIIGKDKDYGGQ